MDKRRVEVLVSDCVERVVTGSTIEDDFIECKASLPRDHRKAARQIAALANSARGADVMWIVGLDENGHRVLEAAQQDELANWLPAVERCFAELAPETQVLHVPTAHGPVTVLYFESDRSPYVVTTDGHKGVDREVPWRVGNSTRSATRAQLLSVLTASTHVPDLELIDPVITNDGDDELRFSATAYFSADSRVVLPTHRWSMEISTPEWFDDNPLIMNMRIGRHKSVSYQSRDLVQLFRNPPPDSEVYEPEHPAGVHVRRAGLIVNGSDSVVLSAQGKMNANQARTASSIPYLFARWSFPIDRSDREIRHTQTFRWFSPQRRSSTMRDSRWVPDEQA